METNTEMDAGEIRYRIEQDPQTGVVTAAVLGTGFNAREALGLILEHLTPEMIDILAEGYAEQRREVYRHSSNA